MSVKFPQIILIILISAVTAFAVTKFTGSQGGAAAVKETAYERVMRTGTIRCGYGIWAPGLTKDPNTGKLGGIFYDYLEAIGKHTGLNIQWTEEIGWGDFPAALNSGRIDAMCFGAWPRATTAKEVLFTEPVYFLPVNAYVRAGDSRFDHAIKKVNASDIKISAMDSELSSELARTLFPQAQTVSVPQLSNSSVLLENVASGKADITFTDAWTGAAFMKENPGKLRLVLLDNPLRLFGHTIPVAKNEHSLVAFLNTATDEITMTGELEAIIEKYSTIPGVLLIQKTEYK